MFYRLDYATVMFTMIYSLPLSVKSLEKILTKKYKKSPGNTWCSKGFHQDLSLSYLNISISTCDTMTTAMRATG